MDGEISPDRVADLLTSEEPVTIVDVSEPVEFEVGHLPDSVNVPLSQLPQEIDRFDGADRIVTVCPRGEASVQAARLIAAYEGTADATIESMAGGIEAWEGELVSGMSHDDGDSADAENADADDAVGD